MAYREIEECQKGDICSFEILAERSSTENNNVITLWKREDDWFQITLYNGKGLKKLRKYSPDEANARQAYEDFCEQYECLPYPEADDYYRRKRKS